MAKNEILYVKGMNLSESDGEIEEEDEDIWDDRKLNDAYDKALRIANAEVAKRIAMSTNSQAKEKDVHNKNHKAMNKHNSGKSLQKKESKFLWKAGMNCRAIYEGDGLEYEAFVLRILNNKECIVKFLGYNNTDIVTISSLKPSLGENEQTRQIEESLLEKPGEEFSEDSHLDKMECSDKSQSVESSDVHPKKKKPAKKKKPKQKPMPGFNLPDLPMPDFAQLKSLGSLDIPIPPPPPPPALGACHTEEQAVSSMLLSWYMSGYYTGLYQGMKRAKEGRRGQ